MLEDGEVKCGFDARIGRLIVKGKGSLEGHVDRGKTCKTKRYCVPDNIYWRMYQYEGVKSPVICHGVINLHG